MTPVEEQTSRAVLAHHSKSFALAGKLLPPWCRRDAAALYAWCRRCDDAVDNEADGGKRAMAVARLRGELESVYTGAPQTDPVLGAMQDVVRRHQIPRRYPDDLISGMEMDVATVRYRTMGDLLLYCYRAAGTVGLMMAHVMRARAPLALRRAADLGIAMQLTNICRDVAEDEARGRVYLPQELLGTGPEECAPTRRPQQAASAVAALLVQADAFYRSGNAGLGFLPVRCAIAIRAAALIYRDIGRSLAAQSFDVRRGRSVVSTGRKLWLLLRSGAEISLRVLGTKMGLGLWAHRHATILPLPFAIPGTATPDELSTSDRLRDGAPARTAATRGALPVSGQGGQEVSA